MVGVITFVASVLTMVTIKFLGKRKIAIGAMFATAVFTAALSGYAKNNLGYGIFSYDAATFPKEKSVTPLILFCIMTFFTEFDIPWVLFGVEYQPKDSLLLVTTSFRLITFIASKTLSLIELETSVNLWGTFAVYAGFAFAGAIYLYFYLPETEGNSLQEIEDCYNDDFRYFVDDPFINFFKKFRR